MKNELKNELEEVLRNEKINVEDLEEVEEMITPVCGCGCQSSGCSCGK